MKAMYLLAVVALALTGFGYEEYCAGDFAAAQANGLPLKWEWHENPIYKPWADVEVKTPGELHYFNPKGKSGSAIRSPRLRAKKGDLITVKLETRGTGTAWFSLYCWGDKGHWNWVCGLVSKEVKGSDDWREQEYTFTVADYREEKTSQIEVALGLRPGADFHFRNVRVCRRLVPEERLAEQTFEDRNVKPASDPELISDNVAPGLLCRTTQAIYRTGDRVDLVPAEKRAFPTEESGKFLSSSVRVYAFGMKKRRDAVLATSFADKSGSFSFKLNHRAAEAKLDCTFPDGRSLKVPYSSLPADFVFSAGGDGHWELKVTSLSDSSVHEISGVSDYFKGVAGKDIARRVRLSAPNGATAEVTVDDLLLFVSAPETEAELRYPFLAQPLPEFDPVKAGWKLVFSDEFDGREMDPEKWEMDKYKAENHKQYSELKDGVLKIFADYKPGTTNLSTTGFWTRKAYGYGYFEARVKFTSYNGWWAAFWACNHSVGNPFLDGFEIDIFEDYYMRNEGRNKNDHNLHAKGAGPYKSWNYNSTLPGYHKDWYTIGAKWTPFEITYYLNGKTMPSSASHSPYSTVTFDAFRHAACIVPLKAIVSGQIMKTHYGHHEPCAEEVYPEAYEVDYVRVYSWPGNEPGAVPEVKMECSAAGRYTVPEGRMIGIQAEVKPAAKTGAKIKAVHLFDSGYYLATKTEPPYDFTVPMTAEYYSKTAWMKPGRSGVRPPFPGSIHVFCVFAEDETGMVGHSGTIDFALGSTKKSTPYQGVAQKVPGKIVVGRYDEGGQGVAYNDNDETNNSGQGKWRPEEGVDAGEHVIGSVSSGEWVNYTVDVAKAGRYRLKFRYGTPFETEHWVTFLLDGERAGRIDLKAHEETHFGTDTVGETVIDFPAGRHVLTMNLFGQFNIGDMEIEGE